MISPIKRKQKEKDNLKAEDLVQIRHDMMSCYGWIPIKEFLKIQVPELLQLNEYVQQDKERLYKKYQAIMGIAGAKKSDM